MWRTAPAARRRASRKPESLSISRGRTAEMLRTWTTRAGFGDSTMIRSASVSASSMSCVTNRMVLPVSCHSSIELLAQPGARVGIERREWLVHQNDVGLERQRAGDRHPLALPAGQHQRHLVGIGAKPQAPSSCAARARRSSVRHRGRPHFQAEGGIVERVLPRQQARRLEHIGKAFPGLLPASGPRPAPRLPAPAADRRPAGAPSTCRNPTAPAGRRIRSGERRRSGRHRC